MERKTHKGTEYSAFSKRLASLVIIFTMFGLALLLHSQIVSASWQSGLFSFMANLVSTGQASADINDSSDSSTSMGYSGDYLQAPANPHPEDIFQVPPIDDNTLVPEIALADGTTSAPVNTDIGTYTVQSGDTISSISGMFDISQSTIKQANGLTSSVLHVGQVLTILPRSGIIYVVQKGDTLNAIAKRYHADVDDILNYNDIASSSLVIGTAIMIPDAEPLTTDFPNTPSSSGKGSKSLPTSGYPRMFPNASELELDNISNWPSYTDYYSCPIAPGAGHLSQGLHSHNAVDLAAPLGTSIHAAALGTVIIDKMNNGWNGGYGNYIVLSHPNSTETLYAHMGAKSKSLVSLGDSVSQGQLIGYVGMTGLTTGPHVHFEVRGAQNPCLYYH